MSTRSSIKRQAAAGFVAAAWNDSDAAHLSRALELACRGTALAHPNPCVGAIVVKNGETIGEGFHVYDKLDHAEIVALNQAGEKARGATLYVTLEPCCTTGRTGPCTKAIVAAGVKRVVAAIQDPNPKVTGRGFAALERAGIQVSVGIEEKHARELNEDFAKWIRTGLPFVTLKAACTLDGQIAQRPGAEPLRSQAPNPAIPKGSGCATGPTRFSPASAQFSRTIHSLLIARANRDAKIFCASS